MGLEQFTFEFLPNIDWLLGLGIEPPTHYTSRTIADPWTRPTPCTFKAHTETCSSPSATLWWFLHSDKTHHRNWEWQICISPFLSRHADQGIIHRSYHLLPTSNHPRSTPILHICRNVCILQYLLQCHYSMVMDRQLGVRNIKCLEFIKSHMQVLLLLCFWCLTSLSFHIRQHFTTFPPRCRWYTILNHLSFSWPIRRSTFYQPRLYRSQSNLTLVCRTINYRDVVIMCSVCFGYQAKYTSLSTNQCNAASFFYMREYYQYARSNYFKWNVMWLHHRSFSLRLRIVCLIDSYCSLSHSAMVVFTCLLHPVLPSPAPINKFRYSININVQHYGLQSVSAYVSVCTYECVWRPE